MTPLAVTVIAEPTQTVGETGEKEMLGNGILEYEITTIPLPDRIP